MRAPVTLAERQTRVGLSLLWAAWADALGFITELADDGRVRERLRGRTLTQPLEWTRRVGGRFGVDVPLPAGCYSDDTQLRLATGRAISAKGFDVEAFARVELPVWPTYALGGGRASKAAAVNLAKRSTPWFGNFFDGWNNAGGNGVAMRIQPHVWSAENPAALDGNLVDVVLNGVTTHGHPRALVGAVIHAIALGMTLEGGSVPSPAEWSGVLETAASVTDSLEKQPQFASYWKPAWERSSDSSFRSTWASTIGECEQMLEPASDFVEAVHTHSDSETRAARSAYQHLVVKLDLANPHTRGSGTATTVAALALAAAFPTRPLDCALLAARMLGTDTDTIATMAAALAGASGACEEPIGVADADYLRSEAARFVAISCGSGGDPFDYPDLLEWSPPRSQLDAVGVVDGARPALAGLGWLEPLKASPSVAGKGATWSWMKSDFGETFLVKHRVPLRPLAKGNFPIRRPRGGSSVSPAKRQLVLEAETEAVPVKSSDANETAVAPRASAGARRTGINLDDVLRWVRDRRFSDEALGHALRELCERGTGDQVAFFAGEVRTELAGRLRRGDRSGAPHDP